MPSSGRTSDSYKAKDPVARANQLANLKGIPSVDDINIDEHVPASLEQEQNELLHELSLCTIIGLVDNYLPYTPYPSQRVSLKLLYGLPLEDFEIPIYRAMTGHTETIDGVTYIPQFENDAPDKEYVPGRECLEAVIACGARSGKSTVISTTVAIFETLCRGDIWRKYLKKGETGYACVIATRREQAQEIIQKNCMQLIIESDRLHILLAETPRKSELHFVNGLKIISMPCNSTAGRGIPIFCLLFDEIAHFFTEGVKADHNIYESMSPRLAQFPNAKTIFASTPGPKQGMFWEWYSEGFNVPYRITLQAPTSLMNPKIPKKFLDRARRNDPDTYEREFLAMFAEQMGAYFNVDSLNAVCTGENDLEYNPEHMYCCAIDQSGLSGKDRFGLAVGHPEDRGGDDDMIIIDCVRSWDIASVEDVFPEIKAIAEKYDLEFVLRDRYASGWVNSALNDIGLESDTRPQLPIVYANLKSLVLTQNIVMPNNTELFDGLATTIASFGKNNSMAISHERTHHGHSDMADALATCAWDASCNAMSTSPMIMTGAFS
jgi:hypothetical protein